ncbi:GAF and ANTAR domain-containing protein [Kineococcus sp. NPDC059986]|uniref:GAF and ANTAR domain-containing protein n=1 Tax=Kineococcus sp. NPDC059986 TaxID=3155538 RepID=UPI00344F1D9E
MNIVEDFRATWIFEAAHHHLDLLPTVLARAITQVLPVDAAGISLCGAQQRVPLGASTSEAVAAEQLQFTLGEGPCFIAYDTGELVIVDEAALRRRWPALHDLLRQHSPYRSIVALPLGHGAHLNGALDLYSTRPHPDTGLDLCSAQTVAALAHHALTYLWSATDLDLGSAVEVEPAQMASPTDGARPSLDPVHPRAWLNSAAVRARQEIWIAVGICNAVLHLDTSDAFALLRAHAYTQEKTLEETAADVVTGRTPAQSLTEANDH